MGCRHKALRVSRLGCGCTEVAWSVCAWTYSACRQAPLYKPTVQPSCAQALFLHTAGINECLPALLVMLLGTVIASIFDLHFVMAGYVLATASSLFQGAAFVLSKKMTQQHKDQTPAQRIFGALYFNSLVSLPLLVVVCTQSGMGPARGEESAVHVHGGGRGTFFGSGAGWVVWAAEAVFPHFPFCGMGHERSPEQHGNHVHPTLGKPRKGMRSYVLPTA